MIPNGTAAMMAEYSPQVIHEYAHNPYTEALPPIMPPQEIARRLSAYPPYNPEERKQESHYRVHFVRRLFQVFQPLPFHLELESRISMAMREGYAARNPLRPQFAKAIREGYQVIQSDNWETGYSGCYRTTTLGFSLIGVSGIGKSTALHHSLKHIPQVILHNNFHGTKFSAYQLTYLKLDCPMDGSIKGLCVDFFIKVDSLLGTEYFKKFGTSRRSTDSMVATMGQVCQHLGCGLLIIDEIQNLSLAKSGGDEKMLNFFVSLNNNIGIPLITVGTPRVLSILQGQLRLARRADGTQGSLFWERMQRNQDWDLLLAGIWPYQWTKKEIPLTSELSQTLYDESQGIIDLAVKLYAMAQMQAILTGREDITPMMVKQVAAENLKMSRPVLDAMKSGSPRKMASFEDIISEVDFDEFAKRGKQRIDLDAKVKAVQRKKAEKQNQELNTVREQAILEVAKLDIPSAKAQRAVNAVLRDNPGQGSVQEVVVQSIQRLTGNNQVSRQPKAKEEVDVGDIRLIVADGRKSKQTAYEALKANGVIRTVETESFWKEVI
ncbi:TniB family protein [Ruminiclostridium papyrosolvens DSM 2782]|uniref:TniB family protein n=2 Tax=Ruminiclostridium papyrosolvens TaxID=29362 RepID=F1T7X6_9FIRM|nr:TniB family protein [Ruminiclostridium papyrosolvens DSM 2782]